MSVPYNQRVANMTNKYYSTKGIYIIGIALVKTDRFTYIAHLSDGSQVYGKFYLQRQSLVAGGPIHRKPHYTDKHTDLVIVGNMRMSKL